MKLVVKSTVKKLSIEIDKILIENDQANSMGALIDYGEWSQQEPDFTNLVKNWGLNESNLSLCINLAMEHFSTFMDKYPVEKLNLKPWETFEDRNPWHWIILNLECLYMDPSIQC
jgi:hypothetical protein